MKWNCSHVRHLADGGETGDLAKLRISVLRAAAERIADEIDSPHELTGGDTAVEVTETPNPDIQMEGVES